MSTQHIGTLLGATCCARLTTLLRRVASLWVWSNLSHQHLTCRNTWLKFEPATPSMSQQGGHVVPNSVAICCVDKLPSVCRGFTAPFNNNTRTLKLKAQPTNAFLATVNQMCRRLLPASGYCRARGNQTKSLSTVQTTYSEAGRSRQTFD